MKKPTKAPPNAIHARVRAGSALERYLSKNPSTNVTTALHELAVERETLEGVIRTKREA